MFPSISNKRYLEFADFYRSRSRVPMGPAPTIIATAFSFLDERGAIDRSLPGYERAAEFAKHVSLINSEFEKMDVSSYSDDELKAIVLHPVEESMRDSMGYTTSEPLCDIAAAVLDVKDGDDLADLGCGLGSFMVAACERATLGSFYGVEEYYDAAMVTTIRAVVLGIDAEIVSGDMFREGGKHAKVFSNYPAPRPPIGRSFSMGLSGMDSIVPEGVKVHSSDWLYNLLIAERVKDDGIGAGVMPLGALSNTMDEQMRSYFVRSGLLKAVIVLPSGMLSGTSVPSAMVVIGHENKKVRLVDASDIGEWSCGRIKVTEEDVRKIVERLVEDGERSCEVTIAELEESRWNLSPARHLMSVEVKDGVPLSGIVTKITRGLGANLKSRICDERTPFRYLMCKDIDNGALSDELPYITEVEEREERYLVNDGDVVVGKMRPFKAAVAHVGADDNILAGGNLYILRPDTEKVLPLYLRLFLESDLGVAQLEASTTGTTIPSVPISAFDEILVPLPSLDEQMRIVEKCEELTKRAEMYERKAAKVRDEIAALLNEDGEC